MNYVELIRRQAEQVFGNKVKAEVTVMRVLSRIQGILKFQAADVLPGAISERWGGIFWS